MVDILPPEADSSITMLGVDEKPNVKYEDVGGLDSQKQEIREAVELPLTQVSPEVIYLVMPYKRLWELLLIVLDSLLLCSSTCIERSVSILLEVSCYTVLPVSQTSLDLADGISLDIPTGLLTKPYFGRLAPHIGTGKTMLVKAVANSTTASFIRVVGSEFVQKYLGEVNPSFPSNPLQTQTMH